MSVASTSELLGLFASAVISASLLPGGSEAAFLYLAHAGRHDQSLLLAVASAGNTLGGMCSWLIGRLLPSRRFERPAERRALAAVQRFGPLALLFSWLPIVGDIFCVAAGWLRVHWFPALAFIAAGKLARYAALLLLVR